MLKVSKTTKYIFFFLNRSTHNHEKKQVIHSVSRFTLYYSYILLKFQNLRLIAILFLFSE